MFKIKKQECIVNFEEGYIFNNYTYDFGRLLKIDETIYRIFWSKHPEAREVLNIETNKISKQSAGKDTLQTSPVVSIVMPVYNVPPNYLKESIDSILNQTFGDFELLIIDDGSTETQGIDLINNYKDPRIRLITNLHNFIDSLNRGIAESKGKYFARMDADDIMLPHRLQKQYDFMEANPETDICGSWIEMIGNKKETVHFHSNHKEIVASLLLSNSMAHPTIMLRKASVCKNGTDLYKKGYDCAEDYKLWTELAMIGLHFANIPEVLLKYRCSENQVTKTRHKEMMQSDIRIKLEYAERLIEKIIEKEKRFELVFDELIKLCNDRIISSYTFLRIVYNFQM